MKNRVAFFHGLESAPKTDKNDSLHQRFDFVLDPAMDYRNPNMFDFVLSEVKRNKIDLLIGSSMGGWFAYCISTITGIPTLLFNPAFHSRPFEPVIKIGNKKSKHTVILGSNDDVIIPADTQKWISKSAIGSFKIHYESNTHRTPIDIFNKWLDVKRNEMNEEWSTESPGNVADYSFLPEKVLTALVPNFLTKRPPVGMLTVEDSSEADLVRNAQKNLSDDDIRFIKAADSSPAKVFYDWLINRGEDADYSKIKSWWEDEHNINLITSIKQMIKRLRPYQLFNDIQITPGLKTYDFSFPSGHSYGSYYIAYMLIKKYPHLEPGLLALADKIAKSRVQAGVHYPSDIAAGRAIAEQMTKNNY
jgi:hypothetical protein